MAPYRRSRYGRYARGEGRNVNPQDVISGDPVRRVLDSYCPHCASDIRSVGPRRLSRCPNATLCGKPLPIDSQTCPNCRHYTRAGDNFCRVCRTSLRSVVRGRGGLYQHLSRVPSPVHYSPPREESQPQPPQDNQNQDQQGTSTDEGSESDESHGYAP